MDPSLANEMARDLRRTPKHEASFFFCGSFRDLSWQCERNVKTINSTMRGPSTRTNPAPGGGQSYKNQNGVGVLMSPWIYESGLPNSLKSEQSVGNSVPWIYYVLCYILHIFFFLNPLWFRFSIICNQKPPSQYREMFWDIGKVLCSGGLGSGLALLLSVSVIWSQFLTKSFTHFIHE